MYVKKICGYVVLVDLPYALTKGRLDSYHPLTQQSRNYKSWVTILDLNTCLECRSHHGRIYRMGEIVTVCYGQTMGYCLSPTIIMKYFSK